MAPEISRRRLLALGSGALGGAAAGSLMPPSLRAALAAEPSSGGVRAVRHVVILMQENRSFDHCFGTLRGVRGFGDRNAVELPTGRPVHEQPAPGGGTVLPFPVRDAAEAQRKDLQFIGDLDHSWGGGARAWHQGWMDGWVSAKTAATMAYYDRRDLPLVRHRGDRRRKGAGAGLPAPADGPHRERPGQRLRVTSGPAVVPRRGDPRPGRPARAAVPGLTGMPCE